MNLKNWLCKTLHLGCGDVIKAPQTGPPGLPCNGDLRLCDRSYGNVTFVGAHDSYATEDVWIFTTNQLISVPKQLDLGARMLQGQAHLKDGHIQLCHTDCRLYDGGPLVDYLKLVTTWLDANPTEVVTLLWVNSKREETPVSMWASAYDQAGLTKYAYVPPSPLMLKSAWPTLGEMITSGKRLVTFMDSGADGLQVPYILDEFSQMWETPFNELDPTFPCRHDRGRTTEDSLMTINHFLDEKLWNTDVLVPKERDAEKTNSRGSLDVNALSCASQWGAFPNFMLLDFVNKGDPWVVARELNGLS